MFFLLLFSLKVLTSQPLFFSIIQNGNANNDFIEKNYVWPKKRLITVPEKKKNFIFLTLESVETTFSSKENGGLFDKDYIPELSKLAFDNTHFSSTSKLGGGYNTATATYTVGSNFAMITGLPLKDVTDFSKGFVPNAYSLFDYLKDVGYDNYLFEPVVFQNMIKIDTLYKTHGNATIYSADTMWDLYPELLSECTVWGTDDIVLFHTLKNFLKEKSKEKERKPFAAIVGTMDTHFPNGFVCKLCPNTSPKYRYLDTFRCSSKQINDFLEYAKTLPIYEDTVFVLVGDHLTMSTDMKDIVMNKNYKYKRTLYNAIVNSPAHISNEKVTKNRIFNAFDWFPTILTALGFTVKGDRLGLGTNLYSGKKTLSEIYGMKNFNKQITKPTNFIKNKIIKSQNFGLDLIINSKWLQNKSNFADK